LTLASGAGGKPTINLSGNINFNGGTLNQATNGATNFANMNFVKAGTQTFNMASGANHRPGLIGIVTNGSTVAD